MRKHLSLAAIVISTMAVTAPSHAFSLGNLAGAIPGARPQSEGADPGATQARTLADYVAGSQLVVAANIKMAQALKLDGEVSKLQATADALKAGTSEGSLKQADVTVSDSTKNIVDKLKSNPVLDQESKATFAAGLAQLATGAVAYSKTGQDLAAGQSALQSASPVQLLQLGRLAYIAKTFPTNAKSFSPALSAGIQFARGQNIPVPANAADATSALGAF